MFFISTKQFVRFFTSSPILPFSFISFSLNSCGRSPKEKITINRMKIPQTTEQNCLKQPKKKENYSRKHIKVLKTILFILEMM